MTERFKSNTKAGDWYATDERFIQLCSDAVSLARSETDQEFANQMMIKAKQHGLHLYLSEKQLKWLCNIADHQMPLLRNN